MSGAHSPVGPSGAAQRIQCPASVTMQMRYPETEKSPSAAEGDAAHWAGACMLTGQRVGVGTPAPNGVILTDDMIDGALMYVDDIRATLAQFGKTPADGAVEVPVSIPSIHPQAFGTPDFRCWVPPMTLVIYDFKFGHRVVEAFENPQIVDYVRGCLDGLANRVDDRQVQVIAKIVQPRAFHEDGPVREWRFTASDIRALVNVSSNAAHEALGHDPKARTGPACWDCTARHACSVFQREFQNAVQESGRTRPVELQPAELAVELMVAARAQKVLEARREALELQALTLAKGGKGVPGYRVTYGQGRTRWTKPPEQIINVGALMGVPLAKPPEVITPKQAIDAGLPREVVATLSETPRTAAKLVEDDGSRARAVFARRTS